MDSSDKGVRETWIAMLHDKTRRGLKPAHIPSSEFTYPDEDLPRDPAMRARFLTTLAILRPDDPALSRERAS